MLELDARDYDARELNSIIRSTDEREIRVKNLLGERYIGVSLKGKALSLYGIPGNELGSLLEGGEIEVFSDAQDEVGNTMNGGRIVIHGNCGDCPGYSMRGGTIYIKGSAGYRAGIHMKEYLEKSPVLVIGERAGSFLGEYQAGGTIIVLGLHQNGKPPVNFFCGTGMNSGRIYLRANTLPRDLPPQVKPREATAEDMARIAPILEDYCSCFGFDPHPIENSRFFVLEANTSNPYKRSYTAV